MEIEYVFTFAGFMPKHELTPIGTFSNGDESINQTRTHMKQHIYKSEFISGPEATERQDRLFVADLKYAVDQGYEYISMSDGKVFSIDPDGQTLTEVDLTEAELQEFAKIHAELKQAVADELDEDDEEYCKNCHNLMLIDDIINNTLTSTDDITPQQADTLVKLAQLKHLLVNIN